MILYENPSPSKCDYILSKILVYILLNNTKNILILCLGKTFLINKNFIIILFIFYSSPHPQSYSILFCTKNVLLHKMRSDTFWEGTTYLVIDDANTLYAKSRQILQRLKNVRLKFSNKDSNLYCYLF